MQISCWYDLKSVTSPFMEDATRLLQNYAQSMPKDMPHLLISILGQ
ncbi:hypothetical protein [Polynucleobacter cosmopolitanus]|nr:hypothetical protein [Polynucleobacter cosmopolitanus]